MPILGVSMFGFHNETLLASGVKMLWDGDWVLAAGTGNGPVIERSVRIDAGSAATAGATAAAMSRALGELAGDIAAGLPRTLQ